MFLLARADPRGGVLDAVAEPAEGAAPARGLGARDLLEGGTRMRRSRITGSGRGSWRTPSRITWRPRMRRRPSPGWSRRSATWMPPSDSPRASRRRRRRRRARPAPCDPAPAHRERGGGREDAERALAAARTRRDRRSELAALEELGFILAGAVDYRAATPLFDEALHLAEVLEGSRGPGELSRETVARLDESPAFRPRVSNTPSAPWRSPRWTDRPSSRQWHSMRSNRWSSRSVTSPLPNVTRTRCFPSWNAEAISGRRSSVTSSSA